MLSWFVPHAGSDDAFITHYHVCVYTRGQSPVTAVCDYDAVLSPGRFDNFEMGEYVALATTFGLVDNEVYMVQVAAVNNYAQVGEFTEGSFHTRPSRRLGRTVISTSPDQNRDSEREFSSPLSMEDFLKNGRVVWKGSFPPSSNIITKVIDESDPDGTCCHYFAHAETPACDAYVFNETLTCCAHHPCPFDDDIVPTLACGDMLHTDSVSVKAVVPLDPYYGVSVAFSIERAGTSNIPSTQAPTNHPTLTPTSRPSSVPSDRLPSPQTPTLGPSVFAPTLLPSTVPELVCPGAVQNLTCYDEGTSLVFLWDAPDDKYDQAYSINTRYPQSNWGVAKETRYQWYIHDVSGGALAAFAVRSLPPVPCTPPKPTVIRPIQNVCTKGHAATRALALASATRESFLTQQYGKTFSAQPGSCYVLSADFSFENDAIKGGEDKRSTCADGLSTNVRSVNTTCCTLSAPAPPKSTPLVPSVCLDEVEVECYKSSADNNEFKVTWKQHPGLTYSCTQVAMSCDLDGPPSSAPTFSPTETMLAAVKHMYVLYNVSIFHIGLFPSLKITYLTLTTDMWRQQFAFWMFP
jgi:hypothetical protein